MSQIWKSVPLKEECTKGNDCTFPQKIYWKGSTICLLHFQAVSLLTGIRRYWSIFLSLQGRLFWRSTVNSLLVGIRKLHQRFLQAWKLPACQQSFRRVCQEEGCFFRSLWPILSPQPQVHMQPVLCLQANESMLNFQVKIRQSFPLCVRTWKNKSCYWQKKVFQWWKGKNNNFISCLGPWGGWKAESALWFAKGSLDGRLKLDFLNGVLCSGMCEGLRLKAKWLVFT